MLWILREGRASGLVIREPKACQGDARDRLHLLMTATARQRSPIFFTGCFRCPCDAHLERGGRDWPRGTIVSRVSRNTEALHELWRVWR